jgi:hypothetical protein
VGYLVGYHHNIAGKPRLVRITEHLARNQFHFSTTRVYQACAI